MRNTLFVSLPAMVIVLTSLIFWTCSDSDDAPCEARYLTTVSGADYKRTLYYNEAKKLSAIISQRGPSEKDTFRIAFYYDTHNKVMEIRVGTSDPRDVSRYKFWYDANNVVGIRRNTSVEIVDSLAIRYDAAGRIVQRDYFDSYYNYEEGHLVTRLYSRYMVAYNGDTKMTVSFFTANSQTGALEPSDIFGYTVDGKKRPYPDEYYLLGLATTEVVPLSNVVQFRIVDTGGTNILQETTYSYNASQYPLTVTYGGSTSVSLSYTYACEPPLEP